MASINASTSGAGGIITTADATGNLNIQSAGSTVLALTSSGVAITGTLTASGTTFGNSTLKLVTDSTDIALTGSPPSTYYSIGSSFSVSIPTTGIIRVVSFVGRINNNAPSQGGGPTFGIRIGSTNYWFSLVDDNGTDKYYVGVGEMNVTAYMTSNGSLTNNGTNVYVKAQCLDIAYNSVPTGTQTVQLICSKNTSTYNDNVTLKGTTITTKVGIEFVSAS